MLNRIIVASITVVLGVALNVGAADRGRVVVKNHTVRSDRGTLLRFAHLEFGITTANTDPTKEPDWSKTYAATKTSLWDLIRNHGLNGVRLVIWRMESATRPDGSAYFTWLDKYVDWAASRGMYVCIDYHHKPGTSPAWSDWNRFWEDVAPRYKDRTHVFYEAANEPVSWLPSQYSASDRTKQDSMYVLLRKWAPKTHLIMWSYANLDNGAAAVSNAKAASKINYANASIGFHWYKASKSHVVTVQNAGFPVICTEFTGEYGSDPPGKTVDERKAAIIMECESIGVSWFVWAMQRPTSSFVTFDKLYNVKWCPDYGTWPTSCTNSVFARANPTLRESSRYAGEAYRIDGSRTGASSHFPATQVVVKSRGTRRQGLLVGRP